MALGSKYILRPQDLIISYSIIKTHYENKSNMKRILFLSSLAIFCVLASCSSSSSSDDEDNEPTPMDDPAALLAAQNYYDENLKTFITNTCVSCHENQHNQNNSSNYGSFARARAAATSMYNQVNSVTMPKGSAKLPQDDIDKFEEFRDLINAIN